MDPKEAALLILMFVVFGVPALALAARLAIKPVVDSIMRFRETFNATRNLPPDPRIPLLESEVQRLSVEVARLAESDAFYRQLSATKAPDKLP